MLNYYSHCVSIFDVIQNSNFKITIAAYLVQKQRHHKSKILKKKTFLSESFIGDGFTG